MFPKLHSLRTSCHELILSQHPVQMDYKIDLNFNLLIGFGIQSEIGVTIFAMVSSRWYIPHLNIHKPSLLSSLRSCVNIGESSGESPIYICTRTKYIPHIPTPSPSTEGQVCILVGVWILRRQIRAGVSALLFTIYVSLGKLLHIPEPQLLHL